MTELTQQEKIKAIYEKMARKNFPLSLDGLFGI